MKTFYCVSMHYDNTQTLLCYTGTGCGSGDVRTQFTVLTAAVCLIPYHTDLYTIGS